MLWGALAGAFVSVLVLGGFFSWFQMWLDQPSAQEDLIARSLQQDQLNLLQEESATIQVVDQVMPAVVSITVRKPADAFSSGGPIILFNGQPLNENPSESTREDGLVDVGGGTAFFVTEEGVLLTNRHVTADEEAFYFITVADGTELPVDVVARDTLNDVAVLRVRAEDIPEGGFPVVVLASSDDLRIGETVIAVGNALGEFDNTVTRGIVSGIHRSLTAGGGVDSEWLQEAIQTDAAINPGNSGGPLVNLRGEVIGINTAVSNRGNGLGFAIPISVGQRAVQDVEAFGRIVRPWLGVRYVMLSNENAQAYGFSELQRGAYISSDEEAGVVEGSPADRAGLRGGDLIVKVGDRVLTEKDSLAIILNTYHPLDQVAFEVLREGDMILEFMVTLGDFEEAQVQP